MIIVTAVLVALNVFTGVLNLAAGNTAVGSFCLSAAAFCLTMELLK